MSDQSSLQRAVLLDRDGTINQEVGYLHKKEEFQFIPRVPEAIRLLKEHGFLVIVVTNQAGVAKGYYPERAVTELHLYINQRLAESGAQIDAFYYCPHHPAADLAQYRMECNCRKPRPGLLYRAQHDFRIDLAASFMIGDNVADVLAGQHANCRSILVRTGHGWEQRLDDPSVPIAADLWSAVTDVMGLGRKEPSP